MIKSKFQKNPEFHMIKILSLRLLGKSAAKQIAI